MSTRCFLSMGHMCHDEVTAPKYSLPVRWVLVSLSLRAFPLSRGTFENLSTSHFFSWDGNILNPKQQCLNVVQHFKVSSTSLNIDLIVLVDILLYY